MAFVQNFPFFCIIMTLFSGPLLSLIHISYETSFTSTHNLGRAYEPTATGTLNLGEIVAKVQSEYPEISQYTCEWMEPSPSQNGVIQYSVPQISSFCYMTPANGVVRYDVRPQTDAYDVTYYL